MLSGFRRPARLLVQPFFIVLTLAAADSPKFEVASIKPNHTGNPNGGIRPAPGGQRYVATNITLKLMIMVAYRVRNDQISDGPAWMDSDRFDMNAQAERPSTSEELHLMLQDLLADRFKLRFHRESRELSVYLLTVDKSGSIMQPHPPGSAGDPWIDVEFTPAKQTWRAKFAPMDYIAWRLSMMMDRPVVDKTDLKGGYDFDLSFVPEARLNAPDGTPAGPGALDASGPTIFDALKEQLGLKLERQKAPVPIMIIDNAEKLDSN